MFHFSQDLAAWLTIAPLSLASLVVCVVRPHPVDALLTFNKLVALAMTAPLRHFNPPSVLLPSPQGAGALEMSQTV